MENPIIGYDEPDKVPDADATLNDLSSEVIGNKADAAAAGAVTSTESLMAYIKQVVGGQINQVYRMDFWSGYEDLITITGTSSDITLPSVTVLGIPSGATFLRVLVMLKYRTLEDTSAVDNKLSTAGPVTPAVQVKETVSGSFTDAITLIDDMFQIAASTREGGDVLIGNTDVKSEVDANDTYALQLDDVLADGANLLLRDVQVGLRIEWTV